MLNLANLINSVVGKEAVEACLLQNIINVIGDLDTGERISYHELLKKVEDKDMDSYWNCPKVTIWTFTRVMTMVPDHGTEGWDIVEVARNPN